MRRATIYLEEGLHKALKLKALEAGQSISYLVNDAVREALDEDLEDLNSIERGRREKPISYESHLEELGTVAGYETALKPSVLRDVRYIPAKDLKRINAKISDLANDPRPRGSVKLSSEEFHRVRIGDHRVVYEIVDKRPLVTVIEIAHRREACG